jgi:uncharacterized protein YggE
MYLMPSASRLRPLALAAALALGVTAMPGNAQTAPTAAVSANTLLSVSAEAHATRVPDIARLSTGVVTQAADPQAAMQANANQMSQVVASIS